MVIIMLQLWSSFRNINSCTYWKFYTFEVGRTSGVAWRTSGVGSSWRTLGRVTSGTYTDEDWPGSDGFVYSCWKSLNFVTIL